MSRQRIAYTLDELVFKRLGGMSVNYTISESKEAAGNRHHQECFCCFFDCFYTCSNLRALSVIMNSSSETIMLRFIETAINMCIQEGSCSYSSHTFTRSLSIKGYVMNAYSSTAHVACWSLNHGVSMYHSRRLLYASVSSKVSMMSHTLNEHLAAVP